MMPSLPVAFDDDEVTAEPTRSAALSVVISTHLPFVGRAGFGAAASVWVAPFALGPAPEPPLGSDAVEVLQAVESLPRRPTLQMHQVVNHLEASV